MDTSDSDRRDENRAPIELKVEYKRLNTFFADYTRNISRGGTFIRTDRPLDIGTEFVFALTVPQIEEPLRLKGRVQWVTTKEEATVEKPTGMGIKFVYDEGENSNEVAQLVERLMQTELGEVLTGKLLGKS